MLLNYDTHLRYVSDEEFIRAQERLNKNIKHKYFFREEQYCISEGTIISEDFAGQNLRRSYYNNCEFIQSNLTNVGLSGSIIKSTKFSKNILENTKLDSCELDECNFTNEKLTYVNFSKSIISNSTFYDCEMEAINFTDTLFVNVNFVNCIWKSLSLENAIFNNTSFHSVEFRKLNFEFSQFHNVYMNNVRLPFPTIPYIINGLEYIMNTSDNIWVSSAQSPIGKISKEEYLTYIDDLEMFYIKAQNYFPLANIYIAKKQWEQAFYVIILGIQFSIKIIKNFRLVYYFCKLLQLTKVFSANKLSEAYDFIMKCISDTNLRPQDYYNYSRYKDSIRNILMNEQDSSSLQFSINTNIMCTENNKLVVLIAIINDIVNYAKQSCDSDIKYYVEIRHGSPFELFIKFFGTTESLLYVLVFGYCAIWGAGRIVDKIQEFKKKELDYKKENLKYIKKEAFRPYYHEMALLEVERKKLENHEKEINIKKKEFSLKNNKDKTNNKERKIGLKLHRKLNASNIEILSGWHTLSDNNNEINDKEIIHYYHTK